MGWVFFPGRALAAVAGLVAALAALAVFASRPEGAANRRLALALGLEGVAFACGEGLMYLTDDPAATYAYQALTYALMAAVPLLYFRFFATLDTPVARLLRPRWVAAALALAAVGAAIFVLVRADVLVGSIRPHASPTTAVWDHVPVVDTQPLFYWYLVAFAAGLAFALLAWRSARSEPAKRQARLYLVAFGTRDAIFAATILFVMPLGIPGLAGVLASVGYLAFVPLLAYAILKAQLFDIDLKVKWTVRRGTVVGIIAVASVVVAEVAQNWLSDAFGYLAGGLAAGVLLLALRPLDRLGSRVADAAMPRVQPTDEYFAFRKHEVYRAAVESARQDGEVTAKERALLDTLRASLGIDPRIAAEIERAERPSATPEAIAPDVG